MQRNLSEFTFHPSSQMTNSQRKENVPTRTSPQQNKIVTFNTTQTPSNSSNPSLVLNTQWINSSVPQYISRVASPRNIRSGVQNEQVFI